MYSKNELSDQLELHVLILFSKLYFLKWFLGGIFHTCLKNCFQKQRNKLPLRTKAFIKFLIYLLMKTSRHVSTNTHNMGP